MTILAPILAYQWTCERLVGSGSPTDPGADSAYQAALAEVCTHVALPVPAGLVSVRQATDPFVLSTGAVATISTPDAPTVNGKTSGISVTASKWRVCVDITDATNGGDPEALAVEMRLRLAALATVYRKGFQDAYGVPGFYVWELSRQRSRSTFPKGTTAEFAQACGVEFDLTITESS